MTVITAAFRGAKNIIWLKMNNGRRLLLLFIILLLFMGTQAHSQQQGLAKGCPENSTAPCVTAPRAIYSPSPKYPKKARKAGRQGVCTVSAIVETDGRVTEIRVLSSLGSDLDEEAIKTVKRWKFTPAMKDGKPVRVKIAVEVAFNLSETTQ